MNIRITGGDLNGDEEMVDLKRSSMISMKKKKGAELAFKDVEFTVDIKKGPPCKQKSKKKKIIKGVTGVVPAGSFLAILGSSGAGKVG